MASFTQILARPEVLLNQKISGLTLVRWLDTDSSSAWYEAAEDAGTKRIVYAYGDPTSRDISRTRVHGFRTTTSEAMQIENESVLVHVTVGDYRIMMPRLIREYLTSSSTMPREVCGYIVDSVLGHGYKGVTFRVRREEGVRTPYALKLTIAEEYEGGSYLPETDRMVDLASRDRDHFPQVHGCGEWSCDVNGSNCALIYFVEDFISGLPLNQYLVENGESVSVTFLETFLREMLGALSVLELNGLVHDDLHSGNIIVHDSPTGMRPYIIDFGSTKPKPTRKERDDIRNLASHVASIANEITAHSKARTAYEDRALDACERLHAKMSDDDPMRGPESSLDLLSEFDRSFERGAVKQTLLRPFDFGNAEEVMDNELLQKLAAKSFPWRDLIESSANLLLIGPRGCGKTTVFRSMSFSSLAEAGQIDKALQRDYVGVYISCNKEFRLRFSALSPEVLAAREGDLRHYFNLIVLREFLHALNLCLMAGKAGESDVRKARDFLSSRAGLQVGSFANHKLLLEEMESWITGAIGQTRMSIWNNQPCERQTTQGLIADLADLLSMSITPFRGKTLFLFVDDYTERKVAKDIQKALNHLLFVPNAAYRAKISSEVFGVPKDQTFGAFLDQDRDYKELNLGTLYYLDLPSNQQKSFLREIVDNRLKLCGYKGTVSDIIGPSRYRGGSLAKALKNEAEFRAAAKQQKADLIPSDDLEEEIDRDIEVQQKKAYYHGWDTICDLCTGDVSNILEVLHRLYESCRVSKESVVALEPRHQHSAIQAYSLQYISKIKGIPEYGEDLFAIVNAFGSMSGRLLKEYPVIDRGGGRRDPYQLIRVEMDEGYAKSAQKLMEMQNAPDKLQTERAMLLWTLLQRYCLFIDAEESRSRRNTLASKIILRRIFCPAFSTAMTNSECYTVDKGKWERFCTDPDGTADRYARDVVEEAMRKRGVTGQGELPYEEEPQT